MLDDLTDPAEIQRYLDRLALSIQSVQRRLKRFEDEFGMDSELFYSKLHNAELSERIEYAEWAGEHEMLKRLEQQRAELQARLQGGSA
jgi:hypothetical protein